MDTALLASIAQQMMSNDTVDVRAPVHWGQRRMKFLLKECAATGYPDETLLAVGKEDSDNVEPVKCTSTAKG
jgi:hypothetical protein